MTEDGKIAFVKRNKESPRGWNAELHIGPVLAFTGDYGTACRKAELINTAFEALVEKRVREEREACAKAAERWKDCNTLFLKTTPVDIIKIRRKIASAIRARTKEKSHGA